MAKLCFSPPVAFFFENARLLKRMGCVSTRPEADQNPRIFRVINVDTSGRHLRRGRLEVTDTQLIFYQRNGGVVIRWPLTCLRRYGFDSEIFSFECGRRCATGSGVYGFKCKKAETLFTYLQESINQPPSATDHSTVVHSPMSNGIQPNVVRNIQPNMDRNMQPSVDESGYLEPITVNNRNVSTVTTSNGTVSPGGYVCIHESSHLSSWSSNLPRCCSSPSHHYVNEDVIAQDTVINQYANQSVIMQLTDSTLPEQNGGTSTSHTGRCCNDVDINTNYTKLDDLFKQEQSTKLQHFYVNVKPELVNSVELLNCEQQEEVNYAELDLDKNESTTSLTTTPTKSPEGYAQIDFDKTVALSNSANPCPSFNDDSMRKTRHNAVMST